jgi:periplasmic divalent cation tolerance protein
MSARNMPMSAWSAAAESLLVFISCPAQQAQALAETLVERRLCACVNCIGGVQSVYRWRGAVERGEEMLLIAKTSRARYAELEVAVRELHPYELPEVLAVSVASGFPAYLQWLLDSVS